VSDTFNFHARGKPLRMTDSGDLAPLTRGERFAAWLGDSWRSATRWWRPRTVVSAIDVDAGSITVVRERWSWRRWRWERDE
jgi:hypothetical protein